MTTTIRECSDEAEWEALLDKCPYATVFHTWRFLKIMEKHSYMELLGRRYKSKLYPFIALTGSQPIGLYPIFVYNLPISASMFSPPLGTSATYLGPLIANHDDVKQEKREEYGYEMQKAVDDYIKTSHGARIAKIRTPPCQTDCRQYVWNDYQVTPLYNYQFDLSGGVDKIWSKFDKHLRLNIRNATAKGLVFCEGNQEDLTRVYELNDQRYAEQNTKETARYDYVKDLYQIMHPHNMRIFTVKKDGELLTGVIALTYKKKLQLWIGMSKTRIKGLYPNDYLLWEIMNWTYENGYSTLEITWANTQRLCKYKSKFNPQTSLYFSCEKYSPAFKVAYTLKHMIKKNN